ncbi:MAG: molybdate ABC transporter substrate-binding protein, partial [Ketobacteraceae bacterium]|nr:molybdate ABC transporter substrate-binding protein [Ketobacteraceae bacterium]
MLAMNTASAGQVQKVHVAVASNFLLPMKDIAAAFEREFSYPVILSSASSGKLYAQIRHGAPFHLLFSADQEKPALLEQENLTVPGTRFTYAVGKLALMASQPERISSQMSLAQVIQQPDLQRMALANPRLAPYGIAAVQVLDNLGLKEASRPKWVLGENIAQTYQFVHSGNADIGFVALSQLVSGNTGPIGFYITVPGHLHEPIRQDAVLLRKGAEEKGATAFLQFMREKNATQLMESFGYEVPTDGKKSLKAVPGKEIP